MAKIEGCLFPGGSREVSAPSLLQLLEAACVTHSAASRQPLLPSHPLL